METLILSTRNASKAVQIKEALKHLPVTVLTLSEAGISGDCVEDGRTLHENAMKKALFAQQLGPADAMYMADDTGLFIKALDRRPGIRAARWAGESATTDEITRYTLRAMEGISDRRATFVTAAALVFPNGFKVTYAGKCQGRILEESRGTTQPGMPYSPLFVPDGHDMTWAEMDTETENGISHRGKAFRLVAIHLELALIQSRHS